MICNWLLNRHIDCLHSVDIMHELGRSEAIDDPYLFASGVYINLF